MNQPGLEAIDTARALVEQLADYDLNALRFVVRQRNMLMVREPSPQLARSVAEESLLLRGMEILTPLAQSWRERIEVGE